MLVIVIIVVALLICVVQGIVSKRYRDGYTSIATSVEMLPCIALVAILIIIGISHMPKIVEHTKDIDNIEYETLLVKKQLLMSEDTSGVAKIEILNDIEKWNKTVINRKFTANSKWANWFIPKDIVDNLELIDISNFEVIIK